MTTDDRRLWDDRYGSASVDDAAPSPPPEFAAFVDEFPVEGPALDVACGRGGASLWLASRGLDVVGVDVSSVAIRHARDAANRLDLEARCRFEPIDLDAGLPEGPSVVVLLCRLFRDPRLDHAFMERLAPGGLLAAVALSEVGATPGRFRASPGELLEAYGDLDVIDHGEADGVARLLARRPA